MIAHVGGVPVEEFLTPLVSGLGGLLVALTWAMARVRHPRSSRAERPPD